MHVPQAIIAIPSSSMRKQVALFRDTTRGGLCTRVVLCRLMLANLLLLVHFGIQNDRSGTV